MLSIMVLAYRGMPINELRARGSLDERRAHVFDTYVQRMLTRRGVPTRYAPQQTLGWLAWLARNMVQRSQTIFFVEGMQPDLLPPVKWRWHFCWSSAPPRRGPLIPSFGLAIRSPRRFGFGSP